MRIKPFLLEIATVLTIALLSAIGHHEVNEGSTSGVVAVCFVTAGLLAVLMFPLYLTKTRHDLARMLPEPV